MTQQEIYAAYIADFHSKHNDIVEPTTERYFGGNFPKDTGQAIVVIKHISSKFFSGVCTVYKFDDGRLYEITNDSRGNPLAAIWQNVSDWENYKQPKQFAAFFDTW